MAAAAVAASTVVVSYAAGHLRKSSIRAAPRRRPAAAVRAVAGGQSAPPQPSCTDPVKQLNGRPVVSFEEHNGSRGANAVDVREREEKGTPKTGVEALPVLYDDGFGKASVKDYLDAAKDMVKSEGGPPRWFCPVECGKPIAGAPLLLFLPGIDGTGLGLILHHKPLGKVFEVRCLHIPVNDRTPFGGLLEFLEHTVQYEHSMSQNRPIYLVGDSFGGCLALSVAARNPTIDLVLILSNPATSFGRSQIQPLLPMLHAIPNELQVVVPYLLSFTMGDPLKLATANFSVNELPPPDALDLLSRNLTSLLPRLSDFVYILPKETLLWKLNLLRTASSYANSRLHAVQAEVLVLYSGKDNLLPSADEAKRLWNSVKNCRVRGFNDNGHTLLLEDGLNLMTIIKAMGLYRHSRRKDYLMDYLPPSLSEFKDRFERDNGNRWLRFATSPVLLSTLRNGDVVQGLSGIPDNGPVILVGNHMLMGFELSPLYEEFLREKQVTVYGMAHPVMFSRESERSQQEISQFDIMKVFGAIPVSPINMYKLLSRKSFLLLYPGGAREALHRKGEEYQLFWPDQPEFVRMAARFDATIVPFGVVGEDDVVELVLDYNDQAKIPALREGIIEFNQKTVRLRTDVAGEVAEQDIHLPLCLPKVPGRFYYLFGKPIETKGMKDVLRDKTKANAVYQEIKSEIGKILEYLQMKREKDPYRSVLQRTIYQASEGSTENIPSFDL